MKKLFALFIGVFYITSIGYSLDQHSDSIVEIKQETWTPNPVICSIEGVRNILVLSNVIKSSSGKYLHRISFMYYEEDSGKTLPAPFLVLPVLENALYTWELRNNCIEIKGKNGIVLSLINIKALENINK